ncbi:MAG: MerR family DNA-binding transcriptional regulator [Pseudomonadota bacterium]
MFTIGQIGKRFGISRSTLLYYDAIGLLRPSGRSTANYRLYTEDDMLRWHTEFERLSPEAHQDFLEALGLPETEIRDIRNRTNWPQVFGE